MCVITFSTTGKKCNYIDTDRGIENIYEQDETTVDDSNTNMSALLERIKHFESVVTCIPNPTGNNRISTNNEDIAVVH